MVRETTRSAAKARRRSSTRSGRQLRIVRGDARAGIPAHDDARAIGVDELLEDGAAVPKDTIEMFIRTD